MRARHDGEGLLEDRKVRVIDGTGVSMPDTAANRKRWPYAGNQKKGCGFPVAQLVGLFCLGSGRLVKFALGEWKEREVALARQLVGWVRKGEVLLTDRGFCGWGLVALFARKGVDVVFRLHQRRRDKDGISAWEKPRRPETWGKCLWAELPEELQIRIIHFTVQAKGFRTKHIALCTTLLDSEKYPDEALIALYMRRWKIELFLRDIKVPLGLDILRCQSPAMVEKEIWMQAIAHNMVRALMLEAAMRHGPQLDRLSFKGTVDALREWSGWAHYHKPRQFKKLLADLLFSIASDQVPLRPNRSEPRAIKRRHKSYHFLTKPRHQMIVSSKK